MVWTSSATTQAASWSPYSSFAMRTTAASRTPGCRSSAARISSGSARTRLDAVAADLHLLVGPAEEVQRPVREPSYQVSGAVHQRPRPGGERIWQEALRSVARAAQITPGDSKPTDVQLAGHPDRHGAQLLVQHVQRGVGEGGADGHARGVLGQPVHQVGRGERRVLARAVPVVQVPGRRAAAQYRARAPGVHHLSDDEQVTQPAEGPRVDVGHPVEEGAGEGDDRRPQLTQSGQHLVGPEGFVAGQHVHAGAVAQRSPHLECGDVEGRVTKVQEDVAGADAHVVGHGDQPHDGPMGYPDSLGPPGRPGGVHHGGQPERVGAGPRRRVDGTVPDVLPAGCHGLVVCRPGCQGPLPLWAGLDGPDGCGLRCGGRVGFPVGRRRSPPLRGGRIGAVVFRVVESQYGYAQAVQPGGGGRRG